MSQGGSRGDLDNQIGLALAAVLGLTLALALYPPLVFGGVAGLALGQELTRRNELGGRSRADRRPVIAGAVGLVCLALIVEAAGLSERAAFLRQWRSDGVLRLDFSALVSYPWAWLVPSAALSATAAAAVVVWRRR